jgi:hypothetical protein
MLKEKIFRKSSLLVQVLVIVAVAIGIASCRTRVPRVPIAPPAPKKIIIERKTANDNYTNPALKRFVTDNEGASVVVRDPKGSIGTVSGVHNNSRICSLIEQGLLRTGYNVRDRLIFEQVVSKMGDNFDTKQLHEKTGTDLIFEITDISKESYPVDHYTQGATKTLFKCIEQSKDRNGNPIKTKKGIPIMISVPCSKIFYGYSIEIKVLMLEDNRQGGIYKYYYVPCSEGEGCDFVKIDSNNILYYRPNGKENKEFTIGGIDDGVDDEQFIMFVTKTVIPQMLKDMMK